MNFNVKAVSPIDLIRSKSMAVFRTVLAVWASFVLVGCDSNRFDSSKIPMGGVWVSKDDKIERLAEKAEKALLKKGAIWKVEVDRTLTGRRLQKKGSVDGSMLVLLWLIKDLGFESQIDPENRIIRIVPPEM